MELHFLSSLHVFMPWYLVKDKDNFTFTLPGKQLDTNCFLDLHGGADGHGWEVQSVDRKACSLYVYHHGALVEFHPRSHHENTGDDDARYEGHSCA